MTPARNPFTTPEALRWSNYCLPQTDGRLTRSQGGAPSHLTAFVHDAVLAHTRNPRFTCLGARSAIRQGSYRFGLYPALGAPEVTAGLAHDLFSFSEESPALGGRFSTFIASFEQPAVADERTFERLLWRTLQQLHDADAPRHEWDPSVSGDIDDPHFAFSFAGTAFFIIGLHAASSRVTRRLAWPTLVFNPHRQFEILRAEGRYARLRDLIRTAERTLQGGINPMVDDFGRRSEAAHTPVEPSTRAGAAHFVGATPPSRSSHDADQNRAAVWSRLPSPQR